VLEEITSLCRKPSAAIISFGYPLPRDYPLSLKKQKSITYLSSLLFSIINYT
jgi:hypothetical protein